MSDPRRLVVAMLLFAGACATRTDVRPRLDAFVTDLHARGLFSGAVVVGDERGIVWEGGFGFANLEQQVRFTPSTPADSGSLAKTFTAAAVIALDAYLLARARKQREVGPWEIFPERRRSLGF